MSFKGARAKATAIPIEVKKAVEKRDSGYCVVCRNFGRPNAHYIPRSSGGLGVEQNIVTLCVICHRDYDQSALRPIYAKIIKEYLQSKYKNWNEGELYYKNPLRQNIDRQRKTHI